MKDEEVRSGQRGHDGPWRPRAPWGAETLDCRGWRWREENKEDSYITGLKPQCLRWSRGGGREGEGPRSKERLLPEASGFPRLSSYSSNPHAS